MSQRFENDDKTREFEAIVLPHLDAAYNLARWLTRNDHDAEDLVQAAFVRAFRFFDGFRGGDARLWLLTIVRHTYFTSLRDDRHEQDNIAFDEELHHAACESDTLGTQGVELPESAMLRSDTRHAVNRALDRLPGTFREVVVLKEMDDLSYKEIAEVTGIPIGTVMSRLARARKLLVAYLKQYASGG
ncbi:sigma-70 family RNA polymerase sigma factor [Noviherbaspirillum galbum]|uniref:Sigma-70 family RNA polymerase sigma factor n=1 Tax=Noviherbaspirillum galbum TaxID=2709383 RepID=A0A6B3SYJ4_9BURK|nr:sigma-70 family RNA polymerase sigma factor [Noviherbaspirillum galbum]NEX64885.1 sigma-70 family RNA polymerase sigma factor [Noviherbaspirillum galbum]